MNGIRKSFYLLAVLGVLSSCQTKPTMITEVDSNLESRVFSKVDYQKKFELSHAVIIDVRPRFEFEMSRLPRSFNAYWKDWDLRGYSGKDLKNKVKELQRLLALKGVDPLTKVVILGKGLKGQGEEFLLATTLKSLGLNKISFIDETNARKAVVSHQVPKIENVPYWHKDLVYNFNCSRSVPKAKLQSVADVLITQNGEGRSYTYKELFKPNLQVIDVGFPKNLNTTAHSHESLWAYGLAFYFLTQGRRPCVY